MNAYELADEIDSIAFDWLGKPTSGKLAKMLRQQADRIETLQTMLAEYTALMMQQKHHIAELEKDLEGCEYFLDKQQSAEPVAWMDTNGVPSAVKSELYSTPLYTTPHHASDVKQIKELSDEELNKAFDYYCDTDEGVLRFDYELRDEWKKEQLIRWKEAFKKASEK